MHIKELKVIVKVIGRKPSTEKIKTAAARLERSRNDKKSYGGKVAEVDGD